jgi:peptidyl-prolyl cis-trans isomerase B (cyclophilin B)
MPRPPTLLLVCLVLAVAGCGGDDEEQASSSPAATATPSETPTPTPTPEDTGGEQEGVCEPAAKPEPKDVKLAKPKERLDPSKKYVATVTTNCGAFEITLDAKRAPKTGGSFKYLADKGFYDGLGFHRIVPGFVIEGGDPKGDGSGGPGYSIVEAPPPDLTYDRGVVAMAKTALEDPGTSGSQFFVVTGDGTQLPPDYALVGKVTAGQDVVDLIGVAPVGPDEQPIEPIVIESVKVAES